MTAADSDPEGGSEETTPTVPSGWVDTYPHRFLPVRNGEIAGPAVEAFQLRPGDQQRLLDWVDRPGAVQADGAVIVVGKRVALGDYLVRDGDELRVEPAAGFAQRYTPAG